MAWLNPNPTIPFVELTPDLDQPLSFGPSPSPPLMLFPVRLETRFTPRADGGADLRVRVYPDKIHIETHEPELTADEITWGKHFWHQTWRAAADEEAKRLAWRQLVERFDRGRAAWVARTLKPLNPDDRPTRFVSNDQPLPRPIEFPSPATKAGAWTRAPSTGVLPKRWWVFGYAGGKLIVKAAGNPIPDRLSTGPDPHAAPGEFDDGELAIDAGMKWMVDFAEAEKIGMGIRLRLTSEQAQGFDILLVFGTKAAPDVTDNTPDLMRLLDSHHFTDGLGFVLQGTPSNNTADAPSGFKSSDPGEEESYLAERATPQFQSGDESNGDIVTAALGLRAGRTATFAGLPGVTEKEQAAARHMNRALWPATLGYFLTQMMGVQMRQETPLTQDDFSWARRHFINYVRASGPLPAVRVGKQPYGMLPVTSLNIWRPKAGEETERTRESALRAFLISLREVWRANLSQVPRIGRSENPDQDFTDIFSMDGISSTYAVRHLMGEGYLRNLWTFMVPGDQKYWWLKHRELTKASLARVGLDWSPRLIHAAFSGWHRQLNGPVVQSEAVSENAPLKHNYIELLLNAPDAETLQGENFPEPKPQSLLYILLRHAMLQEYWAAAIDLLFPNVNRQMMGYWLLKREAELIGLPNLTGTLGVAPTPWELFGRPAAGVTNDPVGRFLSALRSPPADPAVAASVAPLLELRESLALLQTLSTAKLQRLLAGTLDLCSHRLDAWITSLATRRLAEMRRANPTGILLGGYGWVMNLKPASPPAIEPPPAGEQGNLLRPAHNPGYTHVPSLAQAATVAVLRSGHLTHSDSNHKDLLAIDLSSERVRLAKWLLDGVRQGQPLGALLGYRFERRLHEARLGQFIPNFREVAPLVATKLAQTTDPTVNQSVESIAANNVVDGLALHRKWKSAQSLPSLFLNLKKQPDFAQLEMAHDALQAELNLLDEAIDAVGDALLAESVHHAVQGNPLRTARTLDAVASGEGAPPELDVVHTPRTGIALTHRLVVLFGGPPSVPPGWGSPIVPERADAEPHLNGWAARLLGDPGRVRCVIERIDPATTAVVESKELRLSELRLAPLDYIYADEKSEGGVSSGGGGGDDNAGVAEIEQRIINEMRRRPGGFARDAMLRINPNRGADWAIEELSFGEFSEVLRTARKLITGARGIDASELALPEQNRDAAIDIAELQARADRAEQSLRRTHIDLNAHLDQTVAADPESLGEVLLRAAHFGIPGAVPISASTDHDALLTHSRAVAKELSGRVDQLAALEASFTPGAATDAERREYHAARLRAAFGNAFVVLPVFAAGNAVELEKALAESTRIQDDDALAVVSWLQRASRVREGVARLDASVRYAEALESGEQLNLRIAQLPYRENDRWIGLPLKPGEDFSPSRFSLVVQSSPSVDVRQALAGLLIDEWVEVVPNTSETTGMVFQYDQPNAAPPQSILLAVPPNLDQPWNLWSLQQVLLETLDLVRIRAIDPDALDEVGHFLPALYFAVNSAGDAVSIDFAKLK